MNIKSKNGIDIKDVWGDSIKTYLGMLVHGFPNCFLGYSPQGMFLNIEIMLTAAPTAFSNGPTILECQVDFIVDAIAKMETENLQTIEPTAEAEQDWGTMITDDGNQTLFAETDSWWNRANIPGQPRQILTYIRGIGSYEPQCRATLDGWKGFDVRRSRTSRI